MSQIRLDKIAGTHLASVRSADILLNGYMVELQDLIVGERELYTVTAPTDLANELLLHATPEVMYDSLSNSLDDFEVEANEEGRAYHMTVGDVVTLTEDLFSAPPVVGELVVGTVGSYLMTPVDPVAGTTARFQARVIEQTTLGYNPQTAYAIKVESV
jgi:hypothetical protein